MAIRIPLLLTLVLAGSACAHQAGKEAAAGALDEAGKAGPEQTAPVAQGLARGILEELSTPEATDLLRKIMSVAAAGAVEGASGSAPPGQGMGGTGGGSGASASAGTSPFAASLGRSFADAFSSELVSELGNGQGRLARSLQATAEQIAASMVRGASAETGALFPECQGADRAECLQRKLADLSNAASVGVGRGLRESLDPWPLVAAFALGAAVVAAAGWAVSVSRHLRRRQAS